MRQDAPCSKNNRGYHSTALSWDHNLGDMERELNMRQPDASTVTSSTGMDLDSLMRPVWEKDRELERLAIAHRAHELFEARGGEPGHELEDWVRAKSELHLDI